MYIEQSLQQTQKLIMTQELRQSIEILQYTALELTNAINDIVLANPFLEVTQPENALSYGELQAFTRHLSKPINDYSYGENEEISSPYDRPRSISLQEHLLAQLPLTTLPKRLLPLATYLIGCINDSGYLEIDTADTAHRFRITPECLETVINVLQGLEPVGVASRTLRECLMIQVLHQQELYKQEINMQALHQQELFKRTPHMTEVHPYILKIIDQYLDLVAENKLMNIAKALQIDIKTVKEAVTAIKQLNPRPASSFGFDYNCGFSCGFVNGIDTGLSYGHESNNTYLQPDVYITKNNDTYSIQINETILPTLNLSPFYERLLHDMSTDEATKKYLTHQLNKALLLIKSIDSRKSTMYTVTEAILDYQHAFFEHGKMHLRPLTLKEIAEKVNVHESTVSRATHGKYLQCPWGIFELKYFFQSGSIYSNNHEYAQETIMQLVADIVSKEPKSKPYSDQIIAGLFSKRGITISRRTITKYRLELGIPSTTLRKEY